MIEPRKASFRLVIRKVDPPFGGSIQDELDWICQSLGFFEEIDKDKTAASVFRIVLLSTEQQKPLSSTEIAQRVQMSRGAVINHLNNLSRSGLIQKDGRLYLARNARLERLIEELEEDTERIFQKLKKRAQLIDSLFDQRIEQ